MKFRALGALLQICLIVVDFSTATDEPATSDTNSPNADEHSKLLLECQHPDYRTYIKCLKRQKRQHHWTHEHDSEGEPRSRCFDECRMDQCNTTKCVHDCHKHCMKKTKETRQIITQYETTCVSDDCKEDNKPANLPTTNITTNIDVNNVINNHPATDNCVGPCCGRTPCNPGLTLVPQIQLVPQITFGLSYGPQFGGVDCSICANPFFRYRCDTSCYPIQGTGQQVNQDAIVRTPNVNSGCQSPHCVGGV